MKYAYITKETFTDGEIAVEARTADGALIFGFRTRDYWGWQERARSWTPSRIVPVFQANRPAELRS